LLLRVIEGERGKDKRGLGACISAVESRSK
jgi:hypothetical protein